MKFDVAERLPRPRQRDLGLRGTFCVVERRLRGVPAGDRPQILDGQRRGQPPSGGVEFGTVEPDQLNEVADGGNLPPHCLVLFPDVSHRLLDVAAPFLDESAELLKQQRLRLEHIFDVFATNL